MSTFHINAILSVVTYLLWSPVSGQLGKDCSSVRTCMPHQFCYYGYCTCHPGYVRNERQCFEIKQYGEDCFYDAQCPDHRMVCRSDGRKNSTVKFCLCNEKLYTWSAEHQQCVLSINLTNILASLESTYTAENVDESGHEGFFWIVIGGLSVVVIIALVGGLLVFYGCCLYECFDYCERHRKYQLTECPPSCPNYKGPAKPTTPV